MYTWKIKTRNKMGCEEVELHQNVKMHCLKANIIMHNFYNIKILFNCLLYLRT